MSETKKYELDNEVFNNEIIKDISNEFWLDKDRIKELIDIDTKEWLDALKAEISRKNELLSDVEWKKISPEDIEKLAYVIEWARKLLEKESAIEIKVLKNDIENINNVDLCNKNLEKYLPDNLLNKAKNPVLLHEHILGFALWTWWTIATTVEALWSIWKWIVKSPYDIYMIVSWKWECEKKKKI